MKCSNTLLVANYLMTQYTRLHWLRGDFTCLAARGLVTLLA
jgi:hypothetical protein